MCNIFLAGKANLCFNFSVDTACPSGELFQSQYLSVVKMRWKLTTFLEIRISIMTFLAAVIEMAVIETVIDHALFTLTLGVLRFTLFLYLIKMLHSAAAFVTSAEDISNQIEAQWKDSCRRVFYLLNTWRGASQWNEALLLEHSQLSGVKSYGIFKSWKISWYKRRYLQCYSKQSLIQASILFYFYFLLTLEKSQTVFIVDNVVCPGNWTKSTFWFIQ